MVMDVAEQVAGKLRELEQAQQANSTSTGKGSVTRRHSCAIRTEMVQRVQELAALRQEISASVHGNIRRVTKRRSTRFWIDRSSGPVADTHRHCVSAT
jgi:hypothetical protein